MSIKPIDYQVLLPRTPEVSKIQSDEQHRNQAAYQQQAATVQHKADDSLRQVHSQDKSQQAQIRDKQGRNQGQDKGKKKNDKEESQKSKSGFSEVRTSTIDIKI